MRTLRFVGLMFIMVAMGVGCPQAGPPKPTAPQAQIGGTVTNNGKPLPAGCEVIFHHKDQGATLAAKVDAAGKFTLAAADPRIGIPAGKYQVAVRPPAAAAPAVQPASADYKGQMMTGGAPAAPAAAESKDVPAKFHDHATSGLEFEAKTGTNEFVADLAKS